MNSTKYKFLAFGVAFGLMFPLLGTAFVCVEEGCPDGVLGLHLKTRLMQIIDLAPFVLGTFSYLLGLSVDRRNESERVAFEAERQKSKIQQELAQQLQAQNDELRELNSRMDGLVYTASHDLKTPAINFESMLKMLRMVKDQPGSEAMVEEILTRMEAATRRFKTTISDLLEVSLVERQDTSNLVPVSLDAALKEILASLSAYIDDNNAKFDVNLETDMVLATVPSVNSVFQNLITNAIKYRHPDRAPHIKIHSRLDGDKVVVTVEDNGSGIDLERQGGKVFKMFTRFHTTSEGTGIGLYIVKRTLHKVGADVQLESTVGVGTKFIISLQPGTANG